MKKILIETWGDKVMLKREDFVEIVNYYIKHHQAERILIRAIQLEEFKV